METDRWRGFEAEAFAAATGSNENCRLQVRLALRIKLM